MRDRTGDRPDWTRTEDQGGPVIIARMDIINDNDVTDDDEVKMPPASKAVLRRTIFVSRVCCDKVEEGEGRRRR